MKTKLSLCFAALLGCFALMNTARAQSDSSDSTPPPSGPTYGMLGQGYFNMDLGLQKYRNAPGSSAGEAAGLGLNLPATDNLDVNVSYGFAHASSTAWKSTENSTLTSLVGFYKFKRIAPFASIGLGYSWQHDSVASGSTATLPGRYDRMIANVGTGVEIPVVTDTSVRLGVAHDRGFRNPHSSDLSYDLSLAYKVNDVFVTDLGADLRNGRNGTHDAVTYRAGFSLQFD